MKEINDILKRNNIIGCRYQKKGKCILVDDNYKKIIIKPNKTNIYKYLNYRNFDNYPNINIDSGYEIMDYIESIDIPVEQKMLDLIIVISNLHKKTTYYKKISEFNVEEMYKELKEEINNIRNHYDEIMYEAETSIYMSPSQYLLVRNISFVYDMIKYCEINIDKWYKYIQSIDKIRVCVIHNNLKLEHFINNTLISWDNSKVSLPIFDLYKLYRNTYNEYDWNELLNLYMDHYELKKEELFLFNTLIGLPLKINMTSIEIDNVREVNNKLNYLKSTYNFISTKKDEIKI